MSNEAAKRLRGGWCVDDDAEEIEFNRLLDAALAAERRDVVDLIRHRLAQWDSLTDMAPLGLRGFVDGVLDTIAEAC